MVQEEFDQETAWYVDAGGGLNVGALLVAFQTFFREHSEHWSKRFQYQEAWPQLLLQAFLQRVVNSGGRIEREYGLGRGRTDLLIVRAAPARRTAVHAMDLPTPAAGGRARRQGRDRVQGAAWQPGTDHRGGPGADGGLHGPVRGAGRAPSDHRPRRRGPELGREGLPPADDVPWRRRHRRVGHVNPGAGCHAVAGPGRPAVTVSVGYDGDMATLEIEFRGIPSTSTSMSRRWYTVD